MQIQTEFVDVAGRIRTLLCRPKSHDPQRRFPGVLFFSDIFQLTQPHVRLAERLAGHGYIVASPELYGRFEPAGTVLDFERDRQRALTDSDKTRVEDIDGDRRAILEWLKARSDVATIFAAGWCFGGHLAFRAALEPDVRAAVCCYGTGIHSGKLGASTNVDSLARAAEIRGDLLLVWGRNDPHIPADGRARIHAALDQAGTRWRFAMYDAEHAFMRDEGPRYDPASTDAAFNEMLTLFRNAAP